MMLPTTRCCAIVACLVVVLTGCEKQSIRQTDEISIELIDTFIFPDIEGIDDRALRYHALQGSLVPVCMDDTPFGVAWRVEAAFREWNRRFRPVTGTTVDERCHRFDPSKESPLSTRLKGPVLPALIFGFDEEPTQWHWRFFLVETQVPVARETGCYLGLGRQPGDTIGALQLAIPDWSNKVLKDRRERFVENCVLAGLFYAHGMIGAGHMSLDGDLDKVFTEMADLIAALRAEDVLPGSTRGDVLNALGMIED